MTGRLGPGETTRREDVAARQLIERNRATIERLADQISGGGYSAMRHPRPAPQPAGLSIHDLGQPPAPAGPQPYVRISANDRVVLADGESGRQLHHLGEIRRVGGVRTFVLATAANGFFAPLDAEIAAGLAGLDGLGLTGEIGEERLAAEIATRLELA